MIVPYLIGGGHLLITGSQSGALKTKREFFGKYEIPILDTLVNNSQFSDRIFFTEDNLGLDYFEARRSKDDSKIEVAQARLLNLLNATSSAGYFNKLFQPEDVTQNYRISSHRDKNTGRYFFDFLNVNFDLNRDSWVGPISFKFILRLPVAEFGKAPKVSLARAESSVASEDFIEVTNYRRLTKDLVEVTIDNLQTFATLFVDPVFGPANEFEKILADTLTADSSSKLFAEWNAQYSGLTGLKLKDPILESGLNSMLATIPVTFDIWYKVMRKFVLPTNQSNILASMKWTSQNANELTFDEWNYYYGLVTGQSPPAAEAAGLTDESRNQKISLEAWVNLVLSLNVF